MPPAVDDDPATRAEWARWVAVAATVAIGRPPGQLRLWFGGGHAHHPYRIRGHRRRIANPGQTVSVVDTATSKAQTPITTGTLPAALAVTPDGKDVLVANGASTRSARSTWHRAMWSRR